MAGHKRHSQQSNDLYGNVPSSQMPSSFQESYYLLLELSTQEPTMQACFKIIESTCMANGLSLKVCGKPATKQFTEHLHKHYIPFLQHAIRFVIFNPCVFTRSTCRQTSRHNCARAPTSVISWYESKHALVICHRVVV